VPPIGARRWPVVAVILALALGLRLGEIARTSYRPVSDAGSYLTLAAEVASSGDYTQGSVPGAGAGGSRGPTAYFAPAYPYMLAVVDLLDGHPIGTARLLAPARISQAALGTIAVGLIGLVAFECFGWGVALAAMALAAIYPVLIETSALVIVENLLSVLVLGSVWAALRARRARSAGGALLWVGGAGILTGLAALAHVNGLVLVAPLLFASWQAVRRFQGGPLGLAGPLVLVLCAAATIAPWTIRNELVMHRLIPISDETGITLVGTYNAASAHDRAIPYQWRYYAAIPRDRALARRAGALSEPELSARLEHQAAAYVSGHPLAPLEASGDNILRLLELEGSRAWRTSAASIDLNEGTARIGVLSFWVVGLAALLGLALGGGARAPGWLWWVPVLLALSVIPVNAETPRFRLPIDPFLLLLAAYGLSELARRLVAGGALAHPTAGRPRARTRMWALRAACSAAAPRR